MTSIDKIEPAFILSTHGAKVYLDPMNHEMLDIPEVHELSDEGSVYEVVSVGFHFKSHTPCVIIATELEPTLYLLPVELSNWVRECLHVSQEGTTLFPAFVEFKTNRMTDRTYVEIV